MHGIGAASIREIQLGTASSVEKGGAELSVGPLTPADAAPVAVLT